MKSFSHIPMSLAAILIVSAVMAIVVGACEERFFPEIDSRYSDVLVVDGMITSNPGPYLVKLSLSSTIDQPKLLPLGGYNVLIVDDQGNSENCVETEIGIYKSSPNGMQGIPGRKYKLLFQSPQGESYSSDFEELMEPVEIEAIYPEVEYSQIEVYPYDLPGYQFYLDAAQAPNDSSYFMWNLTETFRYESDFEIFFSYYDKILHPVQNHDTLKVCWKTNNVNGFYLMGTAQLSSPKVTRFPLNYVPTDERQLSVRYSLLAEQFVLTEKAYKYWKSTIEQNTNIGELYTKQLYQIRGNISNTNDIQEPVFGYFFATAKTRKRIFVNTPDYPVEMYFPECVLINNDFEMYGWMFLGPAPPASNPLYITESASGERALPGQACLDCLLKGGTVDKPDFWTDN